MRLLTSLRMRIRNVMTLRRAILVCDGEGASDCVRFRQRHPSRAGIAPACRGEDEHDVGPCVQSGWVWWWARSRHSAANGRVCFREWRGTIVTGPAFPAPPKPFPAPLNSFFDSPYCFFGDKRNNRDYQISSTIAWARNLAAKFRVETIVPLHVGCRFLLWRPKKELGRSKRFSVPA